MQASNRRQAALSESQRGFAVGTFGFMKPWANSYKPPLASPGGKLDFLAIGTSEPIDKKD